MADITSQFIEKKEEKKCNWTWLYSQQYIINVLIVDHINIKSSNKSKNKNKHNAEPLQPSLTLYETTIKGNKHA